MIVKRSSARKRVRLHALVFTALASSIVMSAGSAAAQDPRKAQATPIFEEGLRLADKNKHAEALEKFRKAYATYPSPNTLFNVARSEHILGMTLDALRDYREALKNPILSPPLGEQAKKFVGELEKTVGRVMLTGPAGTSVALGGQSYHLPVTEPIDVLPGVVTAKVETEGAPARDVSATAVAGSVVTLDVSPASVVEGPATTVTSPPVVVEPPSEERPRGFWTTQHIVATALTGVAVVGVGAGIGFSLAREGHVSDASDVLARDPSACRVVGSPSCQAYDDAVDGASSAKVGAIVSYAVGGAALVGAIIAWWPRHHEKASGASGAAARLGRRSEERGASVRVLPSSNGLWVTGTF